MEDQEINLCIYNRVSTTRQAEEGVSLDYQLDECKRHIKSIPGAKLTKVYRDEGVSAKEGSIHKRPEFMKMMNRIREGLHKAVVIYKLDRLFRSVKDLTQILEEFKKHGVELISIRDHFDTTSAIGKAVLHLIGTFAQLESDQNSERTKCNMEYAAKQGFCLGGRVVGYNRGEDKILHIIPQEAKLVCKVFQLLIDLGSAGAVLKHLNENGYRMPVYKTKKGITKGGGHFNKQTVISWISNQKYIGKSTFNGEVYEGLHEPIIAQEIFDSANKILDNNRETKHGQKLNSYPYLLKGIFTCGNCGSKLTPKPSGGRGETYHYYCCTKRVHQKTTCSARLVPANPVDDLVLEYIKAVQADQDIINKVTKEANKQAKVIYLSLKEQHKSISARLNGVEGQISNLVEILATDGDGEIQAIKNKIRSLEAEKNRLVHKEAEIRSEKDQMEERLCSSEILINSLESFSQIIEGASRKDLAKIIPLFVRKVEWQTDEHDPTKGLMKIDFFEEFRPEMAEQALWKRNRGGSVNHSAPLCQAKLPSIDMYRTFFIEESKELTFLLNHYSI